MSKENRNQGIRLLLVFVYTGILFLINYLAFGSWVPLSGEKGLWFYSAAASIILGNLLVTPFYTKPVDSISYGVLAGTSIYLVNKFTEWIPIDQIVYCVALGFTGFVLSVSLIAIAAKDSVSEFWKKTSQSCMVLSDYCGNQKVIFSVVFLFALIVFHRESANEMFLLTIAWTVTVVVEPDKHLWNLFNRIKKIWSKDWLPNEVGIIAAYQTPRIILIRQHEDSKTDFGTIIAYKDSHAATKLGIALNYVGRDETLMLRAIDIDVPDEIKVIASSKLNRLNTNSVIQFDDPAQIGNDGQTTKELHQLDEIIGIVDQDTTVEQLEFEVIKDEDLSEGRLVEVEIQGKCVIYQIMDGHTKEDIVSQKNKYGYARATAMKIGLWNDKEKKFEPAKWLPNINSPVYLKKATEPLLDAEAVGHFPKTTYNVRIKSIHELVTHNTAILGILGIGKSFLAIELVERMVNEKIKVICIDLTNQYAKELPEIIESDWSNECLNKIQEAGKVDSDKFQENPSNGGSIPNLISALGRDISDFIHIDTNHYFKIYNPSDFFATKQISDPRQYKDGNDWKRTASLKEITPVEMTSIITEITLKTVQDRMSSTARVCLIFEEAHSLIPEWANISDEGDKNATNRTARAILQGRKYGMGCLLVTQRTANVTKTILNQCNTIFAMRTFDDTGKAFLANYIGSEYTNRLSSLEARQAVFYGKASSCENPVLIRLNDRENFVTAFREKHPLPQIPNGNVAEPVDAIVSLTKVDFDEEDISL